MISIREALEIIENNMHRNAATEIVSLTGAVGRVLAKDAVSDVDMPPFNRAAMDGYAVISSDGPGEYEVADYIPAGSSGKTPLTGGKVARIMTGAPVPDGADAVVMVEKTGGFVEVGQKAEIKISSKPGANISRRGEDVKTGDVVLRAGTHIGSPEIAVLASVGVDPVEVFAMPRMAIISTGDELVAPGQKPEFGQIRDSNGYSVYAQAAAMGIKPELIGPARDDENDLTEKIRKGSDYDFLLISGGVSTGDRDFAPKVIEKLGYKILFYKVNIKPGKPLIFGVSPENRYVFGMPGNPVSTTVSFEMFIKPALRKFMGLGYRTGMVVNATLDAPFKRKNADREEYIPTMLLWVDTGFVAQVLKFHGSAHISALTNANAFFKVPQGVTEMAPGQIVEARFFRTVL